MQKSTQIVLVYAVGLVGAISASGFLTYQAWVWQAPPNTMAHELRMVGLITLPVLGLSLVVRIATDRLMWRVVRALRRAECHSNASVTQ